MKRKIHYSLSESESLESLESTNSFDWNSSMLYTSGLKISSDFFVAVDSSMNFKILGSLACVSL